MPTTPTDNGVSVFETVRPRLFGIAYRMLGSAAEAEDIVQDEIPLHISVRLCNSLICDNNFLDRYKIIIARNGVTNERAVQSLAARKQVTELTIVANVSENQKGDQHEDCCYRWYWSYRIKTRNKTERARTRGCASVTQFRCQHAYRRRIGRSAERRAGRCGCLEFAVICR